MKVYGVPDFELKEWTPEREFLMTRKVKILFKEVPKVNLTKLVAVDDLIKEVETMEHKINLDIQYEESTKVFDELPDFQKGRAVGMGDIIKWLKKLTQSQSSTHGGKK